VLTTISGRSTEAGTDTGLTTTERLEDEGVAAFSALRV
jgi:hypothetical protein